MTLPAKLAWFAAGGALSAVLVIRRWDVDRLGLGAGRRHVCMYCEVPR